MFDVGLSEMMVIFVVALIVIGPERLPRVARTAGLLWGRAQRYINGIKNDVRRDLAMEDMRQLQEQVKQGVVSVEQAAQRMTRTLDQQVEIIERPVTKPAQPSPAATAPSLSGEPGKFPVD